MSLLDFKDQVTEFFELLREIRDHLKAIRKLMEDAR